MKPSAAPASKSDEDGVPASGPVVRRATVHAIRPEAVEREPMGRPGMMLGGKYRLERRIATGGMASIWSATHVMLDRPVAVKFVDARMDIDDERRNARFMHEAKVAASVRHKNVVDILDFGVLEEDGISEPYMIMELLEGEALDVRMKREPLSVSEIANIMRQVLSGLDAVHHAGIVHRDMKPANVFVTEDGDGLFARVIDFGISQDADDEDRTVIGTPEYMSPEQALGEALDIRSDLYSVGVMLYELLTGVLPFEDSDPMRILQLVAFTEPLALSQIRDDVPELAEVVDKAMHKKREERFQGARAMQLALTQATLVRDSSGRFPISSAGEVRSEQPTLEAPAADKLPIRRTGRVLAILAMAAGIGIAGFFAWSTSHAVSASPAPAPVVASDPEPVVLPPAGVVPAPHAVEIAPPPPIVADAPPAEATPATPPAEATRPAEATPPAEEARGRSARVVRRHDTTRSPDEITRELDF